MNTKPSFFVPVFLLASAVAASCAATNEVATSQAAPASAPKSKSADDAKALEKKQRDVEYAQMQLETAKLDAENERRTSKNAIEAAERELEAAKTEREHFQQRVVKLELDERALSVDRSRQNVLEAQEELAELEAMYAQEDFAKTTKELVMTRGRSRLAMSKRDLELAERRAANVRSFDHPKREKELAERVTKAQNALEDAKARAQKAEIEKRLSVLKAEHALADAKRELEKAQADSAGAN